MLSRPFVVGRYVTRAMTGFRRIGISRPLRTNDRIRVREVRVIDEEGNQLGVMLTRDALERAREHGLDLVEVAPNATPPVCRLMDFGRYKYDQSRREREARKNSKTQDIKEVRVTGILIDQHDLETKARDVKRLLKEGNKVRVSVIYRGARQMSHPEIGDELMRKLVAMLEADAVIESPARQEGRILSMLVSPRVASAAKATKEPAEPEPTE
ncbi:MAG TPA: translation initiation factor IF-3 [Thermomicrobiales bacterium]